jgi:two-component system cell cycle sensor histidine kinase/response regulator CckA
VRPCLAPSQEGSRTLLLVDDEAPVRRLAAKALAREGWEVITASSAEDALETIARANPEHGLACVVSDVVMPGMDGPALVRRLRQQWPGLPAILMSGYADAGLRQSLQAADIFFLAKPFGMNELTRAAATLVPPACAAPADTPQG